MIIRILDVVIKQKIVQRPTPGRASLIVEYIASGKWMDEDILFQSIQSTFNHVNNNLNLSCIPVDSRWFSTTSKIVKTEHTEKLRCETVMNYDIQLDDKVIVTLFTDSIKYRGQSLQC